MAKSMNTAVQQGAPVAVLGGEYSNQTASALIKTGEGFIIGIYLNSGTASVVVRDALTATTPVICNTTPLVAGWNPMPFRFGTGLYLSITGTCDLTVSYH